MLIAPRGRPLIVEPRELPGVLNPGSDVIESSALRLWRGRLRICFDVMLVAIDGVAVWTIDALSPVTVMFSSMVPTCRVTFTLAGIAACNVTFVRLTVLNPISETVTE